MVENSRTAMRHKRDWKPASLDYDFLLGQDDETIFIVCLTELERQILLAALPPLMWKTRYFSDTQEIDTDLVQSWVSRVALLLMENCMNCSNVYMVNQSINALYIENLYQRYDGSTTSVNANCPTTNFDGDSSDERVQALCMGLQSFVKSYVKQWLQNAQIVLMLGQFGLLLFAVPILGWVAVALIGGLAYVTRTYYDALSDETAIENVLCDWFDALLGVAINKTNWGSALTGLSYDGGTKEYLIHQVLCSEVGYDKQWVGFLDAIGNAWPIAAAGVQDCPCDECEPWSYTFDFQLAGGGMTPFASRALWVSGSGWKRGTGLAYAIQLDSPTYGDFVIKSVDVTVSSALAGRRLGQFRIPSAGGTSYDVTVPSGALSWSHVLPGDGVQTTSFWFGVDTYNVTYNGYITTLTIHGCGYNPFA